MLLALFALFVYMSTLYAISMVLRNNGVADIGYGLGFIVITAAVYAQYWPATVPPLLLLVLPLIWGLRLAVRIFFKNAGKPEDFRYRAWRDAWGKTFWWRSFLQVYMLQGLVILAVSSPLFLHLLYPSPVHYGLYILGLCMWIAGFICEVVGDAQLDSFLHNPANKGRIMMSGLWKYSRHPNYFGESLMWWGIAVVSSSLFAYPLLTVVSPLLITYLLLYVSGVPMLEKRWEGNSEWESYKRRTSVFLPLPPKVL
jgi:steroid 5-alpha reductase family enzyme